MNSWVERFAETSSLMVCYAVRSYYVDGAQRVDVRNPDNAFYADQCLVSGRVSSPIGAPSAKFDGVIDPLKHPLVLVARLSEKRSPIVIDTIHSGVIHTPRSPENAATSTAVSPTSSPPTVAPNTAAQAASPLDPDAAGDTPMDGDYVVQNGGSRVIVRNDGSVVISAATDVTLTVRGTGRVRVADENANESVALAGPTYEAIKTLQDKINEMQTWMSTYLSQIPVITLPSTAQVATPVSPWSAEVVAVDGNSIKSQLLKVSNRSEADTLESDV